MLVLTRFIGQKLIINSNIEIIILNAWGPKIRIGIEAPREINIVREELLTRDKNAETLLLPEMPQTCLDLSTPAPRDSRKTL